MSLLRRGGLALRVLVVLVLMSGAALAMLATQVVTLFRARRFCAEVIGAWLGRAILRVFGIALVVHRHEPWPVTQTVYVSNHTSTIDMFALIALGLPRTRFFLSGFLRKVLPLGAIGYLTGIFWTVPQRFPEARRKIFRRADRILRATGDSVYLSPEGQRVTTGEIGPFNKGAFHLATSLRAKIVPFYIRIPSTSDPGKGLDARPGTVEVFFLPAIDTREWRLEDLERNRDHVRQVFVLAHERLRWAAAKPAARGAA
jgi:1-acyl-sn-glycerol-3-phosphate acyltransferase